MKSFYKSFVIGLALFLAFFTAGALSPKKPNILFILADDLGRHQIGAYGSTFYETPHIDKLAKNGLKFSNAYAASPVCSPTRASIMTGKHPARLHLTDYIPGRSSKNSKLITPNWRKELPLEEIVDTFVHVEYGNLEYACLHLEENSSSFLSTDWKIVVNPIPFV